MPDKWDPLNVKLGPIKELPCDPAGYVEYWFIGYSLCIVNDERRWYHSGTGKRITDESFIDTLEAELSIQEAEEAEGE